MGHSWGALGTFPGPPDRCDENTRWLMNLYRDFGLSLGGSSEHLGSLMGTSWVALGASWCILGAPWRPLGGLLWVINMFNIQFVSLYCLFLRSADFSSRSTKIQHLQASWRPLVSVLGPLGTRGAGKKLVIIIMALAALGV